MDLKNLIVPSKTIWADYPGLNGFSVQLAYITKDELMKIKKKATILKPTKQRSMEEDVDMELFQKLWIQAVIKDWRGLKYSYLVKMVPVDISKVEADDCLDYSQDNAELLMKNSNIFDNWVSAMLEDVENFSQNA